MSERIQQHKPQSADASHDDVRQRQAAPTLQDNRQAPNRTGMPGQLKAGIEALSGMNMDHVRVHYDSDRPAQLQALAYAQGSDIHLAPGQEQHLPHEAWHVVQQAQGRVRPTMQMQGGVQVNDDTGLEREADVMGGRALQYNLSPATSFGAPLVQTHANSPLQRVVGAYKPGTLRKNYLVMKPLDENQRKHMQALHDDGNTYYSIEDALQTVGINSAPTAQSNLSVPFPFRYLSAGQNYMDTITSGGGGHVQKPHVGVNEWVGEYLRTSVVAGSDYDALQHGSKRAVSQIEVTGISPNVAAAQLGLNTDTAWEWLHLVAFSIKQTHVSEISTGSLNLLKKTNQPQQITENLVLGTAGANTAMLTYETFIKNYLNNHRGVKLNLFASADVIRRSINAGNKTITIDLANRIEYHFNFVSGSQLSPPFVLSFNPLNPAKPTSTEFHEVVKQLEALTETTYELPDYKVAVGGHFSFATQEVEPFRDNRMVVEDD
ncbi:DUF4157 domain-containing protein [Pseudomonas fakonensis]|uniref:DUF4157 domain-containing protein n=1 Tax=Pseudomonas fakonensis TaxID=2842355 RepID=A0ABX8N523_9PSED|nr:DUF4157 domain-containing protein [Pseudomonas fakonensis]QXH50487.1 DUF4157 domain-containing protein [Pseudomonas fakonensis]